ncbi:YchJ family protein [Streptomyces albus subsp. chlorinus]|uniref:YchJ family protein n=1 Tax=Streptomyces albus TaxID=1888 RepID=UPI003D097B5C
MSRRKGPSRGRRSTAAAAPPRPAAPAAQAPCPCGRGTAYAECCGRFHRGEAVPAVPEELMRSRYTAFAVGDAAYLSRTWHPGTRPARLDLADGPRWTGLEILATSGGSAFHDEGTVTFRAHWVGADGERGVQEECSRFVRVQGVWVYLDGSVT